jgi:electron transport complex protein RnfC
VHPAFHKEESTRLPIKQLKIPPQLVIPLHQSTSDASNLIVSVGDKVLKGQALSKLSSNNRDVIIHASSSGIITDIKEHTLSHPSGMLGLCVFIETDGKDQWVDLEQSNEVENTAADILKQIELAGVVGLGGAAFPSTVKLAAAGQQNIHTLIINAAECEPYISCDDILMRERASKIVSGINILVELLQVKHCLIGIEDNKPEAIEALNKAITESAEDRHSGSSKLDGPTLIKVSVVPTQYPSGDARQLTQLLTGIEIPKGIHAVDSGVLCHNIATAYTVHEAVELGKPLLSRIVTFTGDGLVQPQNVEALIGTPVSFIIEQLGGYNTKAERMLMGGPMMGFALPSDELPITKAANCILVCSIEQLQLTSKTQQPEDKQVMPCIRCNHCAQVCPVNLLPQQLYWHARAHDFDKVIEHKLSDCIECGACSYVCPSYIPLVDYFRFAKTEIKSQLEATLKAARSRERFEFNVVRKERIKLARDEKRKKHKEALQKKKQEEAALASKQGDEANSASEVKPVDDVKAAKQDAIKAAMERAKAKKLARDAAKQKDNNQDAV